MTKSTTPKGTQATKPKKRKAKAKKKNPKMTISKTKKIKLLYWGDSPRVSTGFGVVARELLTRLADTGKYTIFCLGINDKGDVSPYTEVESMLHFPLPDLNNDPYGMRKFPEVLAKVRPDAILALNDIFVLNGAEKHGTKGWFRNLISSHAPNTPIVYYFPVDSRPWTPEWVDLAFSVDRPVVYSRYAMEVLAEVNPQAIPTFIPHGVNLNRFNIAPKEERDEMREKMGATDDTFLVGFVSRNQPRKNPAAAVEVFKMANDGYRKCLSCEGVRNLDDPKCENCGEENSVSTEYPAPLEGNGKLYLHCHMLDPMGINLPKVASDNRAGDDLIFRPNHSIAHGLPPEVFNLTFNALDCHFLPTMAEGFGLTIIEGLACGVPTVATRTTAVTEQLEGGRGILVTPKLHYIMEDASTTRKHVIDPEEAVLALAKVYEDWKLRGDDRWGPDGKKMVDLGMEFCKRHNWDDIAPQFDKTINEAINGRIKISKIFTNSPGARILITKYGNAGDILQIMPAIKGVAKANPEAEIVLAIPSPLVPLFEERVPEIKAVIPVDRMNDSPPENPKYSVAHFSMDGPEIKYETGVFPFVERSRPEIFCMNTKSDFSNVTLEGCFNLTEKEEKAGEALLQSAFNGDLSDDDFVVGFTDVSEYRCTQWGPGDNWSKLESYCDKMGIKVFNLDESQNLPENLAALKRCGLVVTTDNAMLDFLESTGVPCLALLSPYWKVRIKGYKNAKLISKDELVLHGVTEGYEKTNNPSQLIDSIGVGEVFSPIMTAHKEWKRHCKEMEELASEGASEE